MDLSMCQSGVPEAKIWIFFFLLSQSVGVFIRVEEKKVVDGKIYDRDRQSDDGGDKQKIRMEDDRDGSYFLSALFYRTNFEDVHHPVALISISALQPQHLHVFLLFDLTPAGSNTGSDGHTTSVV